MASDPTVRAIREYVRDREYDELVQRGLISGRHRLGTMRVAGREYECTTSRADRADVHMEMMRQLGWWRRLWTWMTSW